MHIRLFEAFAGYGSQAMALKRIAPLIPGLTFESVGISEIDPYAVSAYRAVHGPVPNFGDICKIDWAEVPDFDLFTWSFPCQDISNAGLQMGLSEGSGTRSSLCYQALKGIAAKRPRFAVMENVKGLAQAKFARDFADLRRVLEMLGYDNFWQCMDAQDYGVPQHRERIIMVSILREGGPAPQFTFPKPFPLVPRLKDVLLPYGSVPESEYLPQEKVDKILAHCNRKVAEGFTQASEQ